MSWAGTSFEFPDPLEVTPQQHGLPEEETPEIAPGWYASCYCCGRSYDEQYMVRHETRRREVVGSGWMSKTEVTRYVISYCVMCFKSFVKP